MKQCLFDSFVNFLKLFFINGFDKYKNSRIIWAMDRLQNCIVSKPKVPIIPKAFCFQGVSQGKIDLKYLTVILNITASKLGRYVRKYTRYQYP